MVHLKIFLIYKTDQSKTVNKKTLESLHMPVPLIVSLNITVHNIFTTAGRNDQWTGADHQIRTGDPNTKCNGDKYLVWRSSNYHGNTSATIT